MIHDALERAVTTALDNFAGFPILSKSDAPPPLEDLIAIHVALEGTGTSGLYMWLSWPAAWELAVRVLCDVPAAITTEQVLAVSLELAEEICLLYLLDNHVREPVRSASAKVIPPNEGVEPLMGVTFRLEIGTLTVSFVSADTDMEFLKERAKGITQLLHSYQ